MGCGFFFWTINVNEKKRKKKKIIIFNWNSDKVLRTMYIHKNINS